MLEKIKKFKKWIVAFIIGSACMAAPLAMDKKVELPPHAYQVVEWAKPTTDKQWAEDVKKENFNVKHYYQLEQMEENLTEKLPKVQKDLNKFNQCPECIKWELRKQLSEEFSGQELDDAIEEEYQSQLAYYKWKTDKISQSVERIKKEKKLRDDKFIDRVDEILGTTYYIDCNNGSSTGNGLVTTESGSDAPYLDLDQFTEVARSAGDIAIVRRGGTACDNGSDLNFVSDGTIVSPIIVEADYGNIWGDFASSTQTYTLTFGSKYIPSSASSTDLWAGDWVFVQGDDERDFAYEIETASSTGLKLYLPYKGNQSGSGKTLNIMGNAPIWNIISGDYGWIFSVDFHWKIQGINIKGTDIYGNIKIDSSAKHIFKDCIFEGYNSTSDWGIKVVDDTAIFKMQKCRTYNHNGIRGGYTGTANSFVKIKDCFFDCDDSGDGIDSIEGGPIIQIEESEFQDCNYDIDLGRFEYAPGKVYIRNFITNEETPANIFYNDSYYNEVFIEDYDGVISDNRQLNYLQTSSGVPILQSEISIVRSGGGNTSIKITPSTKLSTNWEWSEVKFFEYPIYADTTSKTYTIYFKTEATANWTNDPTNSELWIEAEYWGHATNNHRKITKSTGVIDFNGSTAWQSVSVTAQPSQAGILYLRGYYAKTKEAQSNIFYVDIAPVIN